MMLELERRQARLLEAVDPSTPRTWRRKRLERYEQHKRAEAAEWFLWELLRRDQLTPHDRRRLNRWIDERASCIRATACGSSGSSASAESIYLEEILAIDGPNAPRLYLHNRADVNYTIGTGYAAVGDIVSAYPLVQATPARQPAYLANGIGGKMPCASHDSSDDFLDWGTTGLAGLAVNGLRKAFASWSVVQFSDLTTAKYSHMWGAGSTSSAQPYHGLWAGGNPMRWNSERRGDSGVSVTVGGGSVANGVPYFVEYYYTGTTMEVVINGTTALAATAQDTPTITLNRVVTHGVGQAAVFMSNAALRWGEQGLAAFKPSPLAISMIRAGIQKHWQFTF